MNILTKLWRVIQVVYLALNMAIIMFGGVALFLINQGEISSQDPGPLLYVLVAVAITTIPGGFFVWQQQLSKINSGAPLEEKLRKVQVALFIRSALWEMPSLLAVVISIITGKMYFLLTVILVISLFVLFRPTVFSVSSDLNLSPNERDELANAAGGSRL